MNLTARKFLALLLFSIIYATSAFANPLEQIQAVAKANDDFYKALNAIFAGDSEPMDDIWYHQTDVTYLSPDNAFIVGWDNVKTAWEKQASMKLGGKVEFTKARIQFSSQMAVVQCYEVGENFDNQGNTVEVKIRATNVFRKIGQEWKMISHHTDLLPELLPAE